MLNGLRGGLICGALLALAYQTEMGASVRHLASMAMAAAGIICLFTNGPTKGGGSAR